LTRSWLVCAGLLLGCDSVLPSADSVSIALAEIAAVPNSEIPATLSNSSNETIGVGVLPCTGRLVDMTTGNPVSPWYGDGSTECEQPMLLLRPGRQLPFRIRTAPYPGRFRFELEIRHEDCGNNCVAALTVRSAEFLVTAP
jgi:hypothetical protein